MRKKTVDVRRGLAGLAVALLVSGLTACGGGGTTSPDSGPVTTALPTQSFSNLRPGEAVFAEVTVNGGGTLSSIADWTSASNDLDIYVTAPSCSAGDLVALTACPDLGHTTAVTAKPEQLAVLVTRGNYRVWVANFGPSTESGTLRMTATITVQ
jgi:hypothetical protein